MRFRDLFRRKKSVSKKTVYENYDRSYEQINHKLNVIRNDLTTMKIQINNLIKLIKDKNG